MTEVTDQPVLQLHSVCKSYGSGELLVQALRQVSLSVRQGELVAVMGPSGCGKSTLLSVAGALEEPTSGQVSVCGMSLADMSSAHKATVRREYVGFVYQERNLIPALTARENVALPLELAGVGARAAAKEAESALDIVGIGQLAHRLPENMSGGQQQRVAIARALIGNRQLLLADEPTGALDSQTGDQILSIMRSRCDDGAAGVLVTHEARHAAWADTVVYLRDGEIIESVSDQ